MRSAMIRYRRLAAAVLLGGLLAACAARRAHRSGPGPLRDDQTVRGWTILSGSEPDAMAVIAAARRYDVNHLQLSHDLVHRLRDLGNPEKRDRVNRLVDAAHAAGIQEVVAWDHALYNLDYYPERFRTGPGRTIDLDDPEFWRWFKQDYREMLDRVPHVDGIVLTFIETGARAEVQYSRRLATPQAKLAAVTNAVADVVIGERGLSLYARTFAYTHEEYENIIGAIHGFERPQIRLMMKETPHDFFLTHPNDEFVGRIDRPTIVEFDIAGEYNGQGVIANTWPEYVLGRWRDFLGRRQVTGYTARTDRFGPTRIVGGPSEINLYALKRGTEDRNVTAGQVYDEFIRARYGAPALPHVKAAFQNAFDIVTSTLYTLGTNMANHSRLDYDPYNSSYARSVSGQWLEPPVARVGHGVDRELHYWRDVVNHLAPPWAKSPNGAQWDEVHWVKENGWIEPGEQINAEYLRYVVTEKTYGVEKAEESVRHIEAARPRLSAADYQDLHHYFARTSLTARLHRAVAKAYFGYRLWARGGEHRTPEVTRTVREGLQEIEEVAGAIDAYPVPPLTGEWNWSDDADRARQYRAWITTGWPKETRGFENPYAGLAFSE